MVASLSKFGRWLFSSAVLLLAGIHLVANQEPSGEAVDVALYAAIGLGLVLLTLEPITRLALLLWGGPKLAVVKVDQLAYEAGSATTLPKGLAELTSLLIVNKREAGGEAATAYDVTATIQAFDESGDEFETAAPIAHGRWIEGPLPMLWIMDINPNRQATLEPNQERAQLACLMTYLRSDDPAHAGQSFPFRDTYWETLGWSGMPPGKWRLVVTLRGRNLSRPAQFELDLENDASFESATVSLRKPWWKRWRD